MTTEPATATPPDKIYRIARRGGLRRFSTIDPVDAALKNAGNRFDVVGGGVLYAGTTREACYGETLARFRPTPKIRDLVKDEKGFMVVGGVPRDWRLQRTVGTLELTQALPFLDMESPDTHAYLSAELASELVSLGYEESLDISDVSNRDRRLSRAIALRAYTATEVDGTPMYSGIRYISRLGGGWECWAVFEGTQVDILGEESIELSDPDLQRVAKRWDLTIF